MRIVYLLLHDFRFASLGIREFAFRRFHFSKEYARRMAMKGHDVKLYVMGDDVPGRLNIELDGYELKAFRPSFRFPPFWGFGNDHSLAVLRELSREEPDVVHFHNYYLWNFPYVSQWSKKSHSRLVAQYHGTDPLHRLKGIAYRPSLRLCDRLLVPISTERAFLTESLHLPRERVSRSPSTGVDTSKFNRRGPTDAHPTLLYVGRVPLPAAPSWEKAPHLLIPIMKEVIASGSKAKLTIAGDGPGLSLLKDSVDRAGISDSVDFLGHVNQDTLPSLYSRASLTFVPLQMDDIDAYWGGTVQESLACGTPVVAFNNRLPRLGRFGLLVPTEAREAARIIVEALGNDVWLTSVKSEGPQEIHKVSDWTTLIGGLEDSYRRMVGTS